LVLVSGRILFIMTVLSSLFYLFVVCLIMLKLVLLYSIKRQDNELVGIWKEVVMT
jgi:hypothetical protein